MESLKHHGVKGMHWGVRRYQNYDGTRIGAKRRPSGGGFWDDAKKKKTTKSVVVNSVRKGTNSKPLAKKVQDLRDEKAVDYAADKMKKKDYSKSSPDEVMNDYFKLKKQYKDQTLADKVKELNKKRLEKASEAANRDAKNLKENGYTKEAEAVQKVADNSKNKVEKIEAKKFSEIQSRYYRTGTLNESDIKELKPIAEKYLNRLQKERKSYVDPEMKDLVDLEIMEIEELMDAPIKRGV